MKTRSATDAAARQAPDLLARLEDAHARAIRTAEAFEDGDWELLGSALLTQVDDLRRLVEAIRLA
jgi:hypothetical protein